MKEVLILEDNIKTLHVLEKVIYDISKEITVHLATSYEEACGKAFSKSIDLFLIDIILTTETPGDISGLRFAAQIRKHDDYLFTPIIFITALADPQIYTYKELHGFAYLEKPFAISKVSSVIQEALKYPGKQKKEERLYFRKDGILYGVSQRDILYIEARNHVLYIYMRNDMLEIPYITIKQFLERAESGEFIQCCRNTIVKKSSIKSVDFSNRYIRLKENNVVLDIGPTFCKKVKRDLGHVE